MNMTEKFLAKIGYVNGPYASKKNNGRKFVSMVLKDGSKRFVSYPKFLVEVLLGRRLHAIEETIDHLDGDFDNNTWKNLRVIDKSNHARQDSGRKQRDVQVSCVWCSKKFLRPPKKLKASRRGNHAGPFCSKQCSGSYSTDLMYGRIRRLDPMPANYEVTYNKPNKFGYRTVDDLIKEQDIPPLSEKDILEALPRYRRKRTKLKRCLTCGNSVCKLQTNIVLLDVVRRPEKRSIGQTRTA